MPSVPNLPGARITSDANGLPVVTEPIGSAPIQGGIVWLPYYASDGPQLADAITQAAHGGNLQHIVAKHAAVGQPSQRVAGYLPYLLTTDGLQPYNGPAPTPFGRLEKVTEIQIPIGQMRLEAQKSAEAARKQLAGDVASIEKSNAAVRRANEPVLQALRAVTGKDLGDSAESWGKWWTDREGYAFAITQTSNTPTIVESVPLSFTPTTLPQIVSGAAFVVRHACFAAGTTVRTIGGERAIETIRAGDLVLSQDPGTGALTYQPVVATYHNPPGATLRVRLGQDAVVATGIHRFWKAGRGWAMARDLRPGDPVRTLEGLARVESVEEDKVQPVFNLEVAGGHSFLVGRLGALVHDNSPVEPVSAPFDALPETLAARSAR
jgi:hypothetical protein